MKLFFIVKIILFYRLFRWIQFKLKSIEWLIHELYQVKLLITWVCSIFRGTYNPNSIWALPIWKRKHGTQSVEKDMTHYTEQKERKQCDNSDFQAPSAWKWMP